MSETDAKENETIDFEASLNELTKIVEQMEQGGLSIEQSLKHFEHGITLTRRCQLALEAAEQKVQTLLEENGEQKLKNLNQAEDED